MNINFRVNRFLMGYFILGFLDTLKINVFQIASYFIYTLLGKFCDVGSISQETFSFVRYTLCP